MGQPLSFTGDNLFAYGATSYIWNTGIYAFQRQGNGALVAVRANIPPPTPPEGYFYFFVSVATDPTNHLAVSFEEAQPPSGPAGISGIPCTYLGGSYSFHLGSYTEAGLTPGGLTTNNTYCNMPLTTGGYLSISPSGKLLAVGGSGLQLFHFNGSDPITHYTGLLTPNNISQEAWDNGNHLYAIGNPKGMVPGDLFVFTATPTSVSPAPGSPYAIADAQSIAVVSLE